MTETPPSPPAESTSRIIIRWFFGCLLMVLGLLITGGCGLCAFVFSEGNHLAGNLLIAAIPMAIGCVMVWVGSALCRRPHVAPRRNDPKVE